MFTGKREKCNIREWVDIVGSGTQEFERSDLRRELDVVDKNVRVVNDAGIKFESTVTNSTFSDIERN